MSLRDRVVVRVKTLLQLGIEPVALYGLYRLGLASGHYQRLEQTQNREAGALPNALLPALELPDRGRILAVVNRAARASLLKEADEIVAGKVHLFGGPPVPLRLTFREPLRHWTDYETHKSPLPGYQVFGV